MAAAAQTRIRHVWQSPRRCRDRRGRLAAARPGRSGAGDVRRARSIVGRSDDDGLEAESAKLVGTGLHVLATTCGSRASAARRDRRGAVPEVGRTGVRPSRELPHLLGDERVLRRADHFAQCRARPGHAGAPRPKGIAPSAPHGAPARRRHAWPAASRPRGSNEALERRMHAIEVTAALQHAIAAGRHRPSRRLAGLEAQRNRLHVHVVGEDEPAESRADHAGGPVMTSGDSVAGDCSSRLGTSR